MRASGRALRGKERAREKKKRAKKKEKTVGIRNGAIATLRGKNLSTSFPLSLFFQQKKTQASRLKKRMQFLLKQADIFQHFMPSGVAAAKADAADAKDAASKKKKKSRHATGRASEDAEDAALLADEAAEDGDASGHRLTVQPGVIKGTMRKYQMEGLNWLIHLYDNSMNGILADEVR